jgi:signal transduction histidine kinase
MGYGAAASSPRTAALGRRCRGARRAAERRAGSLAAAAFALTTAVSVVRHQALHAADVHQLIVVLLGAGLTAVAVVRALTLSRAPRRDTVSVVVPSDLALGTIVLVLLAPSTSWSVVPLVVLLQLTAPVGLATAAGAAAVSAAAVSVPRLTGSADPGLLAGCALAGLVFLAAVALARSALDARARALRELTATRADLATAARRAARLEARRQVAAELHDTVVQSVAGALFLAEAAERTGERQQAEEARGALRAAVADARALVDELEPDESAGRALEEELHRAASRVRARVDVAGERRAVSPDVSLALLRTAQGALGNAERHARATAVVAELRWEEARVVLRISDDGRGFDPGRLPTPGPDGGHGLGIMRRRLAAVGGALVVTSGERGTVVEATVPWSRAGTTS